MIKDLKAKIFSKFDEHYIPTHPRSSTSSKEKKREENYTKTCKIKLLKTSEKAHNRSKMRQETSKRKNKEQLRQRESKSRMADRNPVITILNIMA